MTCSLIATVSTIISTGTLCCMNSVMDGREDGVNCAGREHESAAEVSRGVTGLNRTSQHYASKIPEVNKTSQHYASAVAGLDHRRRCEQQLTNERVSQEGSRQGGEETIKRMH